MSTRLIALRPFSDSVGMFEPGMKFRVKSSTYARRLVAGGFASIDTGANAANVSPIRPIVPLFDQEGRRIKRLRGASGLGDAIYLRPIAEHLQRSGELIRVLSDYPAVFTGSGLQVDPFAKRGADIVAHYASSKTNVLTSQFEDMCVNAHLREKIALRFDWEVQNPALVAQMKREAAGRKIILVHGGREPMGRTDGFGADLLPEQDAVESVLELMREHFLVRIGSGASIYDLPFDLDLQGMTSVSDVLDLGLHCDALVGQCSFIIPLAEVFDKPLLVVWAARGLASEKVFINSITPKKVLSKKTSTFVIDSWPEAKIWETANAFRVL